MNERYHAIDNVVMPGVVVGIFFLKNSAKSRELCLIESLSKNFVHFEKVIICHTIKFFLYLAVDVQTTPSLWFPLIWFIVVNKVFIASDYTIQRSLSFMPIKQSVIATKLTFKVSRVQMVWKLISLLLNQNNLKRCKIACHI